MKTRVYGFDAMKGRRKEGRSETCWGFYGRAGATETQQNSNMVPNRHGGPATRIQEYRFRGQNRSTPPVEASRAIAPDKKIIRNPALYPPQEFFKSG